MTAAINTSLPIEISRRSGKLPGAVEKNTIASSIDWTEGQSCEGPAGISQIWGDLVARTRLSFLHRLQTAARQSGNYAGVKRTRMRGMNQQIRKKTCQERNQLKKKPFVFHPVLNDPGIHYQARSLAGNPWRVLQKPCFRLSQWKRFAARPRNSAKRINRASTGCNLSI